MKLDTVSILVAVMLGATLSPAAMLEEPVPQNAHWMLSQETVMHSNIPRILLGKGIVLLEWREPVRFYRSIYVSPTQPNPTHHYSFIAVSIVFAPYFGGGYITEPQQAELLMLQDSRGEWHTHLIISEQQLSNLIAYDPPASHAPDPWLDRYFTQDPQ